MALYLDASLRRTAVSDVVVPRTYIRSREFDITLLAVPIVAGLATALMVAADSRLYPILLLADLWLLGYHHIVATYTRLAFDPTSLRRNRFLAVDMLVLVTVAAMGIALTAGPWVIASAFLYLQWFHYVRQSYGIARMYYRATPEGQVPGSRDLMTDLAIYFVPIYGIAQRSATMGDRFLGLPVTPLVVPEPLLILLGFAAAAAVLAWIVRILRAAFNDTLDLQYTGFVASHIVIFLVAYVGMEDVNTGWLAINVWHNFQYVLIVWMSNAKQYANGIDPAARFLSRLSQPGRVMKYFACCVAITTLLYAAIDRLTVLALGGGMAATLGVYMGLNFHHHIVNALIWKRRKAVPQG
ncbi:MAG TPA: hypothetical protein VIR54_15395 [Vicinamibacterales bacterium]